MGGAGAMLILTSTFVTVTATVLRQLPLRAGWGCCPQGWICSVSNNKGSWGHQRLELFGRNVTTGPHQRLPGLCFSPEWRVLVCGRLLSHPFVFCFQFVQMTRSFEVPSTGPVQGLGALSGEKFPLSLETCQFSRC